MAPSRLVFVRHGRSLHSELGILAGRAGCPGLTDEGRAQAADLAADLRSRYGTRQVIETSPVRRARETADLIHEALNLDVPVLPDPRLTEPDPGVADGLTHADYASRFGEFPLPSEPGRPISPGGESWNQFLARVEDFVEDRGHLSGDHRWIVTHAGFMVWLVRHLFGATGSRIRLEPGNCSSLEFEVVEGRWTLAAYHPLRSSGRSSIQSDQPS